MTHIFVLLLWLKDWPVGKTQQYWAGLSLRAVKCNTCYGWVCSISPWYYSWNCLLLIQSNHKVTSLVWAWSLRIHGTKNLTNDSPAEACQKQTKLKSLNLEWNENKIPCHWFELKTRINSLICSKARSFKVRTTKLIKQPHSVCKYSLTVSSCMESSNKERYDIITNLFKYTKSIFYLLI